MPQPPKLPEATDLDGTETLIGRKGNMLFRFPLALIRAWMAITGPKGDKGDKGTTGDRGATGPGYTFQRVASSVSSTAGAATVKFATAFPVVPEVLPVMTMVSSGTGPMLVFGIPSNITKTGCDITVYRSRGTLLLTNTPFEIVGGVSVPVVAFGTVA